MGPKKGGGGDAGDAEDTSCETMYKQYRKNCTALACDASKQIKTLYET